MGRRADRLRDMRRGDRLVKAFNEGRLTETDDLKMALACKWFRIRMLYRIKDKDANTLVFNPFNAQRERYLNSHVRDLILKARQLGFTTFEMIDSLDDCLFRPNFSAGCIAHTLKDARDIFDNKVRFAFEHIPQNWQRIIRALGLRLPRLVSDSKLGYEFDNGSKIGVSTSYRGGTLQRLHVSEFGKICRARPAAAQEIVTGAFQAVGLGNQITLESTAEGREGYFFNYCERARQQQDMGHYLGPLDWQFHFYPWWQEDAYRLPPDEVRVPSHLNTYFEDLATRHAIVLDRSQQAWYAKKAEELGDKMGQEYPATPDEAFAQAIEGAYYATQMRDVRKQGRITDRVGINPALPVFTAWDIGMSDATAIWFAQVVGREIHLVNYIEHSGEGFAYYAQLLEDFRQEHGITYGAHFGPHDLSVRELGQESGTTRRQSAAGYGINFEVVPRVPNLAEGRAAVRAMLPMCWFDEDRCDRGINGLDNYRREWDADKGVYKDHPRHDWASHPAKGFETLARSDILTRTGLAAHVTPRQENAGERWRAFT